MTTIDLTNYVTNVDFFDAVVEAKNAPRVRPTRTRYEADFIFRTLQMGRGWMEALYPPREELLERVNNTLKGRKNGKPWNWSGIKDSDRIDNKGVYPL